MDKVAIERIQVGSNVDIKRTDGRVHGALVSSINLTTRTVNVEWFEKGETKGKEIEVEQLLALNPYLSNNNNHIAGNNTNAVATTPAASESVYVFNEPEKPKPRLQNVQQQSFKTAGTIQTGGQKANSQAARNNRASLVGNGQSVIALEESDEDENYDGTPPMLPNRQSLAVSTKRKTHTVQEIEKLKKNRDERRARQEELRQQKQELMNVDPGNPNWEFLGMIREYREQLEYHPLRISDQIDDHQICVCVRKRPLNKKELARREIDVLTVPNRDHMVVHQPQTKVDLTKYLENQTFRFDYGFDETVTNEMVYRFTAQPLVKTIFDQGFATCFAYGQTGSGKTHTMGGDFQGKSQEVSKGIYAMTAHDVFKYLNKHSKPGKDQLGVSCSFFEIYSGKVFDLLNNKAKLRILEDGKNQVQVVGLKEQPVENERDVLELIKRGTEIRTAGQTSANNQSSRSHAIFQIILRKKNTKKLHGKFSLVDLAGNERGADTSSSSRQTRMEGAEINKSLLALKECIRALGRRNGHLPFRVSKLTLVLRDSFIGDNTRTCMIAMVSPGLNSCEHTLNTLRYANRVKELGADPEGMIKSSGGNGYPQVGGRIIDFQSEDSDLALLHSHNEEDLTEDMFEFQMLMDKMQKKEEQVLDEHTKVVDDMEEWLKHHKMLLKRAETVDHETEQYTRELRSLLSASLGRLSKFQEQVDDLVGQLQQEEIAARNASSVKKGK